MLHTRRRPLRPLLRPLLLALSLTAPLAANPAIPQDDAPAPDTEEAPERARIDHEVLRELALPSGALTYRASVRDYEVRDDDGRVTAIFCATSYVLDDARASERPVTFAFNGGPGSSSVWLHMGVLGPMRVEVPSDAENAGAPPYPLVPNVHTLLTHTDLVMVDPVGTGFSHATGEKEDADFWGVEQDAHSVAAFVRAWLGHQRRWASPKYVLGESYGGVRGALVARLLKEHSTSVALNGVIFVSPAFDIQFVDGREDDLTYATVLPTYAATALYHGALSEEEQRAADDREGWLRGVRTFASGPYLQALFAGSTLPPAERERVVAQLARYTGLSEDYLERANLRVSASRFRKELLRDRGLVLGRLDTRYRGAEADGVAEEPASDPMISGIGSAYVAGFQQYLAEDLMLEAPDATYRFSGNGTFGKWKRPERDSRAFAGWLDTVPDLASAMQANPQLRIFCANGWFDVATTVLAAEYNLSRPGIDPERITMRNYDAGHMMYVHGPSLEALARDLRAFYEAR